MSRTWLFVVHDFLLHTVSCWTQLLESYMEELHSLLEAAFWRRDVLFYQCMSELGKDELSVRPFTRRQHGFWRSCIAVTASPAGIVFLRHKVISLTIFDMTVRILCWDGDRKTIQSAILDITHRVLWSEGEQFGLAFFDPAIQPSLFR